MLCLRLSRLRGRADKYTPHFDRRLFEGKPIAVLVREPVALEVHATGLHSPGWGIGLHVNVFGDV